jgi:hypothetical protein
MDLVMSLTNANFYEGKRAALCINTVITILFILLIFGKIVLLAVNCGPGQLGRRRRRGAATAAAALKVAKSHL